MMPAPGSAEAIADFIRAISSGQTPEDIQAYAGSVPSQVQANPSAYGYNYQTDPTGLAYQRNEAFAPQESYDYRTDPSFLSLTRGFQFQQDQAGLQAQHDTGNLDVLQPITESDITAQRDQALGNVDLNAESRGIYQSGERLLNRARTTGDYGRQLSGVQLSGALQRGNIEYDKANSLADIERRRADALASYANPPSAGAPPG